MSLSSHIVGPSEGHPHTHTVVFLHGRDSDAEEFAAEFFESEASHPLADDRTLPALFPTIRWVFPQAKLLRSERFNTDMSQWFDMWSLENLQERSEMQVPGLRSSVDLVIQTIKEEERLVPREKIFLGGISQGFATILAVLLVDGRGGFAGLCGFCSWLPLADRATSIIAQHSDPAERLASLQQMYLGDTTNKYGPPALERLLETSILLEHSRDDDTISVQDGARMREILGQAGFRHVERHEYAAGGHWFNEPQGVDDLVCFLQRAMGGRKTAQVQLVENGKETRLTLNGH